jgi:hypothetical protein
MIPKISAACYAVRSTVHISNSNTLKSVYCAYVHSNIKHGIIFCGKSYLVCKYVRHEHYVTSSVFPEFEVLFQGAKAAELGSGYNMI